MTFLHLNLHTDRSQYVGLITPEQLVDWAKRAGLSAVAVTDHDNIGAAVQLYKHCKKERLKPIYGMEASVCNDKKKRERGTNNLVLIAKNRTGFRNLITLATLGSMYFYYRPRIDYGDLKKYGEGLIALTADQYGLPFIYYVREHEAGLLAAWTQLHDIFGDDLWLEIEPPPRDVQRSYNQACLDMAADGKVKLVATGDPHYLSPDDREFHEHFMRIKVIQGREEWRYPFVGPYHLRGYDEMVEQFGELHGYDITALPHGAAALQAPLEIAESIESFDIKEGVKIPSYFV